MESYLGAAEKISRLAVGDPAAPPLVNIYHVPDEQPQDVRVDGLPFGTRGGLAIRSYFPADGEYVVKVTLVGRSAEPEEVELSVDGERAQRATSTPRQATRGGKNAAPGAAPKGGGAAAPPAYGLGRPPIEFRLSVKGGPRLLGVAFIQKDEVRDEETLRPRLRGPGSQIGVGDVTISGPYNATGPGDTVSRQRIFVCRPASAAEEQPCARRILSTLERRAYRRPVTADDVATLMPFYTAGKTEGGFDLGIQRAIQRLLVSPQFLFRIERDPAAAAPGSAHLVSDLELASRLSFFLWSSIPDDQLLDLASQGKLRQPGVLEHQVARMLADSRSTSLVNNFAEQWLYLRDIESKRPNEALFADFDESLREAFRQETDLFLDSVLRGTR